MSDKKRWKLNWRQGFMRIWILSTVVWMGWVIASDASDIGYFLRFHFQHEELARESQSQAQEHNKKRSEFLAELGQLNQQKKTRDAELLAEYAKLYTLDKTFAILLPLSGRISDAEVNEYDALAHNPYDGSKTPDPYEEIGNQLNKAERERKLARRNTIDGLEPGDLSNDERQHRWEVASKRWQELVSMERRDALRVKEMRPTPLAWTNPFSITLAQLEKGSKPQGPWRVLWLEASTEKDGQPLEPTYDWIVKLLAPPPLIGATIWICVLLLGWLGRGFQREHE